MSNPICYPCEHNSACCKYGADLIGDESRHIIEIFGHDVVKGERIATGKDGCIFLIDNSCAIHGTDIYPAVCKTFPWKHADGTDYEGREICPEFNKT